MRVIRDSDDEFDDEDLEAEVTAPKGNDASPKNTNTNTNIDASLPCEPGTGSTDSLKRTIAAAHRAHFRSPSIPSIPSLPIIPPKPYSSSSTEHIDKKRKTNTEVSPGLSPGTRSAKKKAPKTYGRSKSIHSSPYLDPGGVDTTEGTNEDVAGKIWTLQGTLRDNYATHEPMAMFPEPSSTVPNATYTQQRLLDEVMNPAFLGIEPETEEPSYRPAKSSVPWSDFLNTPSGNTETQSNSQNAHENYPTHHEGEIGNPSDAHAFGPSLLVQLQPQLEPPIELSVPPHNRRSSSIERNGSPLRDDSTCNGVDPQDVMNAPAMVNQEIWDDTTSLTPTRPKYSPITPSKEPPVDSRRRSPHRRDAKQTSPSPKPQQKSSSILNSQDDILAIGIPKEQYKPRPSRSRSLKVDLESPVDYSVRPEKAGKRQSRRSKTTGGSENATPQLTPQKVQQLYDMGFTPKTTQQALKENNNNVDQTIDWLLANGALDDELAPPRILKSKSKGKDNDTKEVAPYQAVRPAKDAPSPPKKNTDVSSSVSSDVNTVHDNITKKTSTADATLTDKSPKVHYDKSPKVQVVIPKSRETQNWTELKDQTKTNTPQKVDLIDAPSRKPKRRKTTLDQPEPIEENATILPSLTKEKKRGRGRPRKEALPSISSETIQEEVDEEPQAEPILRETQPKVTPSVESSITKETDKPARATTPHVTGPPRSISPSRNTCAEASRTPEKLPKTAARSHSPLSKGKVPYRVGLSKRARIAPLLRVMKK